jgi:hypothetical protein
MGLLILERELEHELEPSGLLSRNLTREFTQMNTDFRKLENVLVHQVHTVHTVHQVHPRRVPIHPPPLPKKIRVKSALICG